MKNCIVWLFLGVLLGIFVACDREEDLKPSGLDTEGFSGFGIPFGAGVL